MKDKEKMWILIRIFIVFLIPLLLTLFLTSKLERIELTRKKISENKTIVSIEENYKSDLESSIITILKISPIDTQYEVCFVNRGTKFVYADGTEDTNVTVSLNFDNQTEFNVSYKQTRCVPYPHHDFTYNWRFMAKVNVSKMYETEPEIIPENEYMYWEMRTAKLVPDTDSYGKVKFWSHITLIILIFISWWGFLWLSTRILKYVRFGLWKS